MQPFHLRNHQAGDLGTIINRHGIMYAQAHGYNMKFEALVARICADFIDHFDSARECCWIAEDDNRKFLGCIMLVKARPGTAKLRLLIVEPEARGMGLGGTLVQQCIQFATKAGYDKIELWTQSALQSAKRLYQKAGFRLVKTEAHQMFGPEDIGEMWELDLKNPHTQS